MKKPIIQENRNGFNDIINVYNPGKYQHTLGEYSQVGNQTIAEKKTVPNNQWLRLTQFIQLVLSLHPKTGNTMCHTKC